MMRGCAFLGFYKAAETSTPMSWPRFARLQVLHPQTTHIPAAGFPPDRFFHDSFPSLRLSTHFFPQKKYAPSSPHRP
jgi:hypothetical protein